MQLNAHGSSKTPLNTTERQLVDRSALPWRIAQDGSSVELRTWATGPDLRHQITEAVAALDRALPDWSFEVSWGAATVYASSRPASTNLVQRRATRKIVRRRKKKE